MSQRRPKVPFAVDKQAWHPSLIPGPIVLVSTRSRTGEANIAPKSCLQMVSFRPPILMFSGARGNTTETSILETGEFDINLVDSEMLPKVVDCIRWFGRERIEKTRFSLVPASDTDVPLIDESRAQLECRLHDTKEVASALVVFGEIVAAHIWEKIGSAGPESRYELLDQMVFLEHGLYGRVMAI